MADMASKRSNTKLYGLVYSRGASHKGKPNVKAKDYDLLIGSLPKEMTKKVVAGESGSGRFRERETLSEHCAGNVKGKESTGIENSKAECSKKLSQTSEVFLTGNGKIDTLHKEDRTNINIPIRQKRGADGEMVHAYFLSPEKSLPRLRPRREVPAFRMVDLDENDNEIVVGKRVKVYWSGSRRWFTGHIVAFNKKNKLHSILYEDGDKEVLDLRKERFELEVMPYDPFKLKNEPSSARKADGLEASDTVSVREAVVKENSKDVSGAKTIVKGSESKQKKEAKKEGKTTSPEAYSQDTEVIMKELNVERIPEKVSKVVINKASYKAESGKAIPEAAKESEVEATVNKGCLSSIQGSRKPADDDDLKISISELVERPKSSRKGLLPRAKKMRTDKVLSRVVGNPVEKLEADTKSCVHSNEVKTMQMDVDINGEAMEVCHQYIGKNNEALGKKASEGDEMSNEGPFTTLDRTSKKKTVIGSRLVNRNAGNKAENLIKAESRTAEEDVIASNPHIIKDEREVLLAAQTEFAVSINKEKAKPNVLREEIKLENGEPDKESKEGMDFNSEKSEIHASKESKSTDSGAS